MNFILPSICSVMFRVFPHIFYCRTKEDFTRVSLTMGKGKKGKKLKRKKIKSDYNNENTGADVC